MNLNQITARIGELSAELLTLHNDLTFLVEGGVSRTQSEHSVILVNWQDLSTGDTIRVLSPFRNHGGTLVEPGIYTVSLVEDSDYSGDLPFCLSGDSGGWVFFSSPEDESDYRARGNYDGTNAFGLIQKVV